MRRRVRPRDYIDLRTAQVSGGGGVGGGVGGVGGAGVAVVI